MSKQELTLNNTLKNDKLELQTLPAQSVSSLKSLLCAQPLGFCRKTNSMIMVNRKIEKYIRKVKETWILQTKTLTSTTQQNFCQIGKQIASSQIEKVMQLIQIINPKQRLQQFFVKIHQAYQIITKNHELEISFAKALRQYAYQRYLEKSMNFLNEFFNIDKNTLINNELELRGDCLELCCRVAEISINFIVRTIRNETIEKYGKQSTEIQIQVKLDHTNVSQYLISLCYFPYMQSSQNSEYYLFQTKSIKTISSPKNSMHSLNKKKWQRNPSSEKSIQKCKICLKHHQFCLCRKSRKQFSNEEQNENRQLTQLKFYRNYRRQKENIVLGNEESKKCVLLMKGAWPLGVDPLKLI